MSKNKIGNVLKKIKSFPFVLIRLIDIIGVTVFSFWRYCRTWRMLNKRYGSEVASNEGMMELVALWAKAEKRWEAELKKRGDHEK